jgi:hypothetical protein
MVAVWVVVVVLAIGAGVVAYASRHRSDDVEPSVRQFTEFRDAISRQVAGVEADTRATRRHLDQKTTGPVSSAPVERRAGDPQPQR